MVMDTVNVENPPPSPVFSMFFYNLLNCLFDYFL